MTLGASASTCGILRRMIPILQVCCSIGILTATFFVADRERVLGHVLAARVVPLLLSAVACFLVVVLGAASLFILIDGRKTIATFVDFVIGFGNVQCVSFFTPLQVGDFLLVVTATRVAPSAMIVAAAIIVQRLTALAITLCLAIWFSFSHPWTWKNFSTPSGLGASGMVIGIACGLLLLFSRMRLHVRQLVSACRKTIAARTIQLSTFSVALGLRYLCGVAASTFAFAAFDVNPPVAWLMGALSLAALAGLLPISVGGIGVSDGVIVWLLAGAGYSSDAAIAACFVGRVVNYGTLSLFALVWSIRSTCFGMNRGGLAGDTEVSTTKREGTA